ncbi:hypothetical protein R3P38DRAFT_3411506 [Favolaschia claudopus]|uniref:Uncharacterized protein n=1 Tax=Favolaschia claudopus TaxID=2862362 RepID=A0AAV9Z9Z8_9AGAR
MSRIILSAKSGSDWTDNELHALNITVETLNTDSFFGSSSLPTSTVDPVLLANVKRPSGPLSKSSRLFFRYLEDAAGAFPLGTPAESAVDDFAAFLLSMMDYDEPERIVHQRLEIGFLMCGQSVCAKPVIVVMDGEKYILLVQEDKAEPQLIAEAVAAFAANNRRRKALGLPSIASQVFAGIIPISTELATAIGRAQYPTQVTFVSKLVPPVPNLANYISEGMVPLENRRIVFQCLTAFKQVNRIYMAVRLLPHLPVVSGLI